MGARQERRQLHSETLGTGADSVECSAGQPNPQYYEVAEATVAANAAAFTYDGRWHAVFTDLSCGIPPRTSSWRKLAQCSGWGEEKKVF